MVKYKLKKCYPNSPKLGTIFEYWTDGISEQIYNKSANPSFIPLKVTKDYPEFWEEIKEKEYEVLDKEYIPGNRIEGSVDNPNMWRITSIKRLSDGEIFSVGDRVQHMKDNRDRGIITKIELSKYQEGLVIIYYNGPNYHTENTENYEYNNGISVLEHVKSPLFITEDGKEVFEGDSVYSINEAASYIYQDSAFYFKRTYIDTNNKRKVFSTKEAAQKYIDENKPKYSKNDLFDFLIKYNTNTKVSKFLDKFNEYVNGKT